MLVENPFQVVHHFTNLPAGTMTNFSQKIVEALWEANSRWNLGCVREHFSDFAQDIYSHHKRLNMRCKQMIALAILSMVAGVQSNLRGDEIIVQIENTATAGGFYFTPVFLGFHDGGFDVFDSGGTASGSLIALAEGGDTSGVASDLAVAQATAQSLTVTATTAGPPPFDPGESISTTVDVDTATQRFLNFATMVIPSNDAFFGNADAIELFDAGGNFNGSRVIEITAGMIYDAGSEVNNISGGAAFSALGGASVDENNAISLIDLSDLNAFVGSDTAAGTTVTNALSSSDVVARITFTAVPEPGSIALVSLIGLAGLVRRKRS